MKRINRIVLVIISLAVILSGCKKSLEQQIAEQLELGQRYLTEMNYKEAVVAFQKVIELDEKIIDAYWGLGQAYEGLGDDASADNQESIQYYGLATGSYEKMQELDNSNNQSYEYLISVWLKLGECYLMEDNSDEAVLFFQKVIELDENNIQAQEYLTDINKHIVKDIKFEAGLGASCATISAYNETGEIVWEYETPKYEPTELDRVSEIGQKDDKYYFMQDGSVVAMDVQTGNIIWENTDFGGASPSSAFGENAIYLCGYYGPDFYAISYDGITLERIEQLDERYFWASEIKLLDNQAAVYLYGGTPNYNIPQIYYIDLDTYEVGTEINISGKPWKGAYIKL